MRSARPLLVVAFCTALSSISTTALADGNQAHGLTHLQRGIGLGATASGVGLSGRRAGEAAQPVATASISLTGLPAGAVVEHAWLYWVTYGTAGNAAMTLNGAAITGTAIGASNGTCWTAYPTFQNFAFRADVKAHVTGNGAYALTGFPSGTAGADTQGASLFVVFTEPASTEAGSVLLYDGALTSSNLYSVVGQFTDVNAPQDLVSAQLWLGAGDGEVVLSDGPLRLGGLPLPYAEGTRAWTSSAGRYWDTQSYDVLARLQQNRETVSWNATFAQDCVVFAFSALTFRSTTLPTNPTSDAGVPDGEGNGGGGGETTPPGQPPPGGTEPPPQESGGATKGITTDDSGCGCHSGADARSSPLAGLLFAALAIARRRKPR